MSNIIEGHFGEHIDRNPIFQNEQDFLKLINFPCEYKSLYQHAITTKDKNVYVYNTLTLLHKDEFLTYIAFADGKMILVAESYSSDDGNDTNDIHEFMVSESVSYFACKHSGVCGGDYEKILIMQSDNRI